MEERNRLLIVYAGKTTTADLTIRLMRKFSDHYAVDIKVIENVLVNKSIIEWADVVLIIRGADFFLSKIIKTAKRAGKCCVFYLDDDLLDLYDKKDRYYKYLVTCLKNTDILWVSNHNVAKRCSEFINEKARIVETVVLDPWDELFEYKEESDDVGILFAGSPAHVKMIERYLIPALENVYKVHRNIQVYLIGFKGTCLESAADYIKTTSWFENADEYRRYVKSHNVQIGLAIIEDNPFSRCKFYNKYLEYTKLGVMGIYTNCEPFTFAVKNEVNGLLADNVVQEWTDKILLAIEDGKLRRKCVENAQADLKERLNTITVIQTIDANIPEFAHFKSSPRRTFYCPRYLKVKLLVERYWNQVSNPKLIIQRLKASAVNDMHKPNPEKIMFHAVGTRREYGISLKKGCFSTMNLAFAKDTVVKGRVIIRLFDSDGIEVFGHELPIEKTVSDDITVLRMDEPIGSVENKTKYTLQINSNYDEDGVFGVFENKSIVSLVYRVLCKMGIYVAGRNIIWFDVIE